MDSCKALVVIFWRLAHLRCCNVNTTNTTALFAHGFRPVVQTVNHVTEEAFCDQFTGLLDNWYFIRFCSCAHSYCFSNKSKFVLNVTCFPRFPHFWPTVVILNSLQGVIKSWPTLLTLVLTLSLQHRMVNNVDLVTKPNKRAKILEIAVSGFWAHKKKA